MKIGFIGLGKMGSNMARRLLDHHHEVVVWDRSKDSIQQTASHGAIPVKDLEDLVARLPRPRVIWMMVPTGRPVDENLTKLLELLHKEDIIIEGGNSYWKESQRRAREAADQGIYFLDCGTSGGVWGLENGYSLMYGGEKKAADYAQPIFKSLAPEGGYVYCGESGSGHLVKMVHNGIEYGMMQAYAEGFEILEKSPFQLDLTQIADAWQYGSVVRSWLLTLIVRALKEDPGLDQLQDYVEDSGEGRWTVQTAMDFDVPAHVITASLFNRFQSRQDESFAMKMLAALRNQFGGHATKTKD